MNYNIHRAVKDKLIEIHALLELDSIIAVRKEDKEFANNFIKQIPKMIKVLE